MIGTLQNRPYSVITGEALAAAQPEWRDPDIEQAHELQRRAFPRKMPHIPGLDYYSDWRPGNALSGDYIDYFELPCGNLGLALGDVAGRGIATALLTTSLHSLARALRHYQHGSLCDLTAAIDEMFYEICPDSAYATMFVARYDPNRRFLHYVNAGHEPPVVLRKTAAGYRPVALEPTGPVIGMLRRSVFHENMVSLAPGDLLIAYTDGVCETCNGRGEAWGYERLIATVQSTTYRRAREIVDRVLDAAETFAAGCPQQDDRTVWLGRIEETGMRSLPLTEDVELDEEAELAAVA